MTFKLALTPNQKKIPENLNISQLLNFLELKDDLLVVELNEEVVMRADWETTTVGEGDKLEIVKAIGGG
jgi:sulfur carrier protein